MEGKEEEENKSVAKEPTSPLPAEQLSYIEEPPPPEEPPSPQEELLREETPPPPPPPPPFEEPPLFDEPPPSVEPAEVSVIESKNSALNPVSEVRFKDTGPNTPKSSLSSGKASQKSKTLMDKNDEAPASGTTERIPQKVEVRDTGSKGGEVRGGAASSSVLTNFACPGFLRKRSPFIHNPPQPEERRPRVPNPRTPKDFIINLREDLADFQESHGLPRTRDYSFLSLGLALAQETARAVFSLVLMFAELFPILAIVSLILRFALDKLIEILETSEPVAKIKKSVIFGLQMLIIVIPLWILIGTIIIPLISLGFSIFKRMLRLKGGKKKSPGKSKAKIKTHGCDLYFEN